MAITGNKGEWSEIYTFFKLLGEQKVAVVFRISKQPKITRNIQA